MYAMIKTAQLASVSYSIILSISSQKTFFTVRPWEKTAVLKEKVSNPRTLKIFGPNSKPRTVEARVAQGRVPQGPAVSGKPQKGLA